MFEKNVKSIDKTMLDEIGINHFVDFHAQLGKRLSLFYISKITCERFAVAKLIWSAGNIGDVKQSKFLEYNQDIIKHGNSAIMNETSNQSPHFFDSPGTH